MYLKDLNSRDLKLNKLPLLCEITEMLGLKYKATK